MSFGGGRIAKTNTDHCSAITMCILASPIIVIYYITWPIHTGIVKLSRQALVKFRTSKKKKSFVQTV